MISVTNSQTIKQCKYILQQNICTIIAFYTIFIPGTNNSNKDISIVFLGYKNCNHRMTSWLALTCRGCRCHTRASPAGTCPCRYTGHTWRNASQTCSHAAEITQVQVPWSFNDSSKKGTLKNRSSASLSIWVFLKMNTATPQGQGHEPSSGLAFSWHYWHNKSSEQNLFRTEVFQF